MGYTSGTFVGIGALKTTLINYLTDVSIHGNYAWELVADNPFPRGTYFRVKGINENDHFYVGMMYNDINRDTYKNWLYSENIMHDKIASKITGIASNTICTTNNNDIFTWHEYPIDTSISPALNYNYVWKPANDFYRIVDTACTDKMSIVKEYGDGRGYGKIISFGVFKQFDENLNWDEQGGALNFNKHPIPMTNFFSLISGKLGSKIPLTPPTMPGIGYPLLYTSNTDEVYEYPKSKYWIIKDKYSMNVVIKNGKYWRTVCVGMLPCYGDGTYPFPAMQIGSTGLTANGITSPTMHDPDPVVGVSMDLSNNNTCFSNSLPIFPTRPVDSEYCPTQVAIMNPEGIWQFHGNYLQDAKIFSIRTLGDRPIYAYPVDPPKLYSPGGKMVYPTDVDLSEYDVGRSYTDVDPHRDEYPVKGLYDYSRQLTRVMIYQDRTTGRDGNVSDKITSITSFIPRMFYTNTEPFTYGEIDTIKGKALILPNVWEGRLAFYNYYLNQDIYSIPDKYWKEDMLGTDYDNMTYTYGKRHRMIITLEGEL